MRTLAGLAVISLLLLYVWERVDVVQVGYRIELLKMKNAVLERERDGLQVQLSGLASPDKIAKVAGEKLGMVPPQQGQVWFVKLEPVVPLRFTPEAGELRLAKNGP